MADFRANFEVVSIPIATCSSHHSLLPAVTHVFVAHDMQSNVRVAQDARRIREAGNRGIELLEANSSHRPDTAFLALIL